MNNLAILSDQARLAALTRTGLSDSEPEPSFDRVTRLASKILDAPVSLVSLVDDHRQFFKSCFGLPDPWAGRRETPLSHSFCQHVVTTGRPLVIPDARLDPLVKDNLAIRDLGVIAYLGIPLFIDGQVIGSFCAIDGKPRAWTDGEIATLSDLAESVVTETYLRIDRRLIAQQRDEAEEARRRMQVIVDSIGDAVLTADAEGTITFLNPVAEALCGWTSEKAVGQPLADVFRIIDKDTRQTAENPAIPILSQEPEAGQPRESILIAADGSERPVESVASAIRLANGRVRGIVLAFRDISERRKQERELENRERLFHTLADSIPQLAWMAAADGHIFWYNQRWYDYTGTNFEQMQGWGWQSVHDPAALPRVLERWKSSIATGKPFDMVFPLKGEDGEFHPFLTRVMPLKDEAGNVTRWFGTNTDITEAERLEDELRDARSQLQTALKAGNMGIWTLDLVTGRMICSDTCKQNYGRTPEEAFTYDDLAAAVLDGDRPAWRQAVADAAEQNAGLKIEYRIRWPDGSIHWVCVQGSCVADDTGRAVSMSGVSFNIDDRKQAEDERTRLVDQLNDDDRRKNEFLAMLAHELRNPLAAISNGIQLVGRVDKTEILTEIRSMIQRQIAHLTRLIDDLLDVSRITQGKIALRKETVSLADTVARAVHLVRPFIDQKRHLLTVSLPDRPVRFVADPTRTEQILGNLLTNAAKYTEPGGAIDLSAAVENREIVFRIRDTGVGIAAEMLPQVFSLFTQVDASHHRSQGGLGIGLTLVRTLVEMHGGTVTAASRGKGQGSEFTIRMPIGEPQADAADAADQDSAPPASGFGRVLVVDDNRDTANTTAILLSHRGYQVHTAHTGPDAVEAARQIRPQLILLDIGLPGMSGYEVAAKLRDDECCKDAVLIAVSGYADDKARERSKMSGFRRHLTKPLNFNELYKLIDSFPTLVAGHA